MNDWSLAKKIREIQFEHANYRRALRLLEAECMMMPEGHVVALVGPTRVGKTTLLKEIHADLSGSKPDPNLIPALYVQVETTDRGYVSTRYLFNKILVTLRHPFYIGDTPYRPKDTESSIRTRLPGAIAARQTTTLILDEAHHLLRSASRTNPGAALDSLKCLGNETGIRMIIAGGYELLSTCFASAHLNGRLTIIDLPRYKATDEDQAEFDNILATYDQYLPWSRTCSLLHMRDYIYDGSLGCCGLVSSWIQAALSVMVANRQACLTPKHFKSCRFVEQLVEIKNEIKLGESLLTELPLVQVGSPPHRAPAGSRRPGKRNPTRDKVGRHD